MSRPPLVPPAARVRLAAQLTRRAARAERRQFLAEGPQAVREALGVSGCVREIFATPESMARHADIAALAESGGLLVHRCDETTVALLAGSVSPQGVVAVCGFVDVPLDGVITPAARLVAVAVHVRDPGNAGSLIRCADAAGADAVVFAGSSVDPYNDKAVRASVGSLFHLPVVVGTTVAETLSALHVEGFTVFAADGTADVSIDDLASVGGLAGRVAWMFGNEAWGLPGDDAVLADRRVAVPIYGRAESLNVATAAAVCLYATARAQRAPGPDGVSSA